MSKEILVKIAIKLMGIDPEFLTKSEVQILEILREEFIVKKNIHTGEWSLIGDPTHNSPTWG